MRGWAWGVIGVIVLTATCAARAEEPAAHRSVIKSRDTVLFVGDSLVSESAWSREVGAGLLRVRAGEQIRTYTASWAGAIVAGGSEEVGRGRNESGVLWVSRVALTTRPTVMVMAFGWDDALRRGGVEGGAFERAYEEGLEAIVKASRARVREMFLVSPPADGPAGVLGERERARLASIGAATARVAGRHGARVIALHEGAAREGIAATWEVGSGVRMEGAPSVVAASAVLGGLGFTGEELSSVGWAPCPEPVFERARGHLALGVTPEDRERSRTFRVAGALAAYDESFDLVWRQMELRLAVTNEHRENILLWQRMQVERDWQGVERIVMAREEADGAP